MLDTAQNVRFNCSFCATWLRKRFLLQHSTQRSFFSARNDEQNIHYRLAILCVSTSIKRRIQVTSRRLNFKSTAEKPKQLLAEFQEQGAMQRLGEKVSDHALSGMMFQHNFMRVNVMRDEKIPNLYMPCSLTR